MGLRDFLKECNNRGLFKLLSVYIVTCWVIIQVFSVINEPLKIPQQVVTYIILLFLVGLPFYMFVLWRIKLKDALSDSQDSVLSNIQNEIGFKRKYFIFIFLIGTLSLFSAALIYENSLVERTSNYTVVEDSDKIAVLNFDNNTGDKDLDVVGKMSSDWLIHGITEYSSGEVISPETMRSYASLMGVNFNPELGGKIFDKVLRPNKLITGSYFKVNGKLVFNCVIQDVINNTVLIAFPQVSCDAENALTCIEEIKQDVLGYLEQDPDKKLSLEEFPPNFEAYEKKLLAAENYDNPELYIKLLNESISLDSTYFEPQVLRVQHYYNMNEYEISDSLNKIIDANPKLTIRQKTLLQFCEALIDGKNDRIFKKFKYEYDITPYHLETNSTAMVLIVQFINKPKLAESVFKVEPLYGLMNEIARDIDDCIHCKYRYFMMGSAYNALGEYHKTIDLLEPLLDDISYSEIDLTYIYALMAKGEFNKMEMFLKKKELTLDLDDQISYLSFIGEKYLILNKIEEGKQYLRRITNMNTAEPSDRFNANFLLKDFNTAQSLGESLLEKEPQSINLLSKLAIIEYIEGNTAKASSYIEVLESLRTKYNYGGVDYAMAQYYASIDDEKNAIKFLMRSVAQGNVYLNNNFQNDPIFQKLLSLPKFKEILTYWH